MARATDRTTAYARLVVSGKRLTGRLERLACQRHLDDMGKGKSFSYIFDAKEAERHIDFANSLTIGEGLEKKPLVTRGFQNFIIGSLFGWRKKKSKELRFRESYIQIARQNGKSFIAGDVGNDKATLSGYKYGSIYCTATKQDQANLVWKEIKKFIESDKDLSSLYKIRDHDHVITNLLTKVEIKAIGGDTKSADGFRSILAVIDEYHAHKTDQMYKLMLKGQVRVDSALTMAITTAGYNLNSACYKQRLFCEKILEKVVKKDTLFIYITEMDKNDDIWDYHNWAKANPLNMWLDDTTIDMDMVKRYAETGIDAKVKGGEDLMDFLTKSLNVWVTNGESNYLNLEKWRACSSGRTLECMRGQEAFLGIDLSQGGDLTSIGLVFPQENGKDYIHSQSFMPELRVLEHEKKDEAPYRIWVNQKQLILTSGLFGLKTDYKYIIKYLKDIINQYEIKIIGCGYDAHNASAFLADLDFLGCDLTEIVQSAKSLNDVTVDFKQSVDAGLVEYDKNAELLSWSAANATTVSNSFGETKVNKLSAGQRIDPIYAVLNAWKVKFLNEDTAPKQSANDSFDEWKALMELRKNKEGKA